MVKNKSNKFKAAMAVVVAALVLAGSLSGVFISNKKMEKWRENQFQSIGITQEEASDELSEAFKKFYNKYRNLDVNNTKEVGKYLEDINKTVKTKFEAAGSDKEENYHIKGITLEGKNLVVRMSTYLNKSQTIATYKINENLLAEIYMCIINDDADVKIKLPMFICEIMQPENLIKMENYQYIQSQFYGVYSKLCSFINSRGYNATVEDEQGNQNFSILSVNEATKEITFGYRDGNVTSKFTIVCLRGVIDGGILLSAVFQDDKIFVDAANDFHANAGKIIDLLDYFAMDGSFYTSGAQSSVD